tara:strand:+ start:113 stop:1252 length:1140 start_codon:yes stop_codon:yes gene_type:complete
MGYSKLCINQTYTAAEQKKIDEICIKYNLDKNKILVHVHPKTKQIEKYKLKTGIQRNDRCSNIKKDKKFTDPFRIVEGTGSIGGKCRGSGGFEVEKEVFKIISSDILLTSDYLSSTGIIFGNIDMTKCRNGLTNKIIDALPENKKKLLKNIYQKPVENVRRPIMIKANAIDFKNNTNRNIADFILHFDDMNNRKAGTLFTSDEYISQKSSGLVSFINIGIRTKCFNANDLINYSISKKAGKLLLQTLGLDTKGFCDVFNNYKNKISNIEVRQQYNKSIDFTISGDDTKFCKELRKLLSKSMGVGNSIVSHKKNNTYKIWKTHDKKIKIKYYRSYYGGKKKEAKRVDIEIETDDMIYRFNIRAKDGKVYPSHLMCDFEYI